MMNQDKHRLSCLFPAVEDEVPPPFEIGGEPKRGVAYAAK